MIIFDVKFFNSQKCCRLLIQSNSDLSNKYVILGMLKALSSDKLCKLKNNKMVFFIPKCSKRDIIFEYALPVHALNIILMSL